jgi:hypothetical protein
MEALLPEVGNGHNIIRTGSVHLDFYMPGHNISNLEGLRHIMQHLSHQKMPQPRISIAILKQWYL